MTDDISSAAVIRAIYHLGDRNQRRWPTAEEIADYLKSDVDRVRTRLRDLRRERLFRDRRRGGKQVWMPWEAP